MPDLRLVGVHDDGQHLLLVDDGGERYLLAVDESLRGVLRDRSSLGSLQPQSPSAAMRPREVQARIAARREVGDDAAGEGAERQADVLVAEGEQ